MLPALDSSRDRMSSDHDPPPGSCCCSYVGTYVDMQLDILLQLGQFSMNPPRLLLEAEMIEYIRIRFGFESFSSNLEYLDSDSRILETK